MIGFSYNSRYFILCIKIIFLRGFTDYIILPKESIAHTHKKMKNFDPSMTLEFISGHYHITQCQKKPSFYLVLKTVAVIVPQSV